MNTLFAEKLRYFEFKGIQLEALGYIPLRQYILNNNADGLAYFHTKYYIFLKRNSADIQKLKNQAMDKQNYEKVDEFYQYQDHLDKSYFNKLVKFFKHISKLKDNLTKDAWISDFCSGLASKDYEYSSETFLSTEESTLAKSFTRTQDLGVWACKFSAIPSFSTISQKWKRCDFYSTSQSDPIFGYLKFNSRSNYKPGLVNSLGLFEHPLIFQILAGLYHLSSTDPSRSLLETIGSKIEIMSKILGK